MLKVGGSTTLKVKSTPPSHQVWSWRQKHMVWCQHSESLYQSAALRLYDSESASKIITARWSSLQDKLRWTCKFPWGKKKIPVPLSKICLCVCSNGQQESARGGRGHVRVASKINLAAGLFWKNVCSAAQLSELMGLRGFTHLSV